MGRHRGAATMRVPDHGRFAAPASSPGSTLFADEFNAGALDRSKWNVEGPAFWVNNEQQAYVDAPETIQMLPEGSVEGADGGVLALKPVFREGYKTPTGRTADFISGRIDTSEKFAFTYGTASARIKMPDAVGVWPAFWLLGYGEWPGSGETDIMEYVGEKGWTAVAMHGPGYSGETPLVNRFLFRRRYRRDQLACLFGRSIAGRAGVQGGWPPDLSRHPRDGGALWQMGL